MILERKEPATSLSQLRSAPPATPNTCSHMSDHWQEQQRNCPAECNPDLRITSKSKSCCFKPLNLLLCSNKKTLNQWFLTKGNFVSHRYLATSGSNFGCHTGGRGTIGVQWVEARPAAKHPAMHRVRIIWPNMSIMPKLRNCDLNKGTCTYDFDR